MSRQQLIETYSSQGDEYTRAFTVFLAHTDQKDKANSWLKKEVSALARRDVFIDAGAGTGKLTAWLQPWFSTTIAIEPNPSLRAELQNTCSVTEILPVPIIEARPSVLADFVLCSHVFYYIDPAVWTEHVRTLAAWLRPGGVLAVALQNHDTDCMRMLSLFTGETFDLRELAKAFTNDASGEFDVRIDLVEANIRTDTFESAYIISEFMLNLLSLPYPPRREALERYIAEHFRRGDAYRMSCDQDFLRIQRQA